MKRFLLMLLKLALVIGALALALTPVARERARLRRMADNVEAYRRAVEAMDPSEREAMLAGARAATAEADLPDPCGNGMLAVLELPKLGATLPVWRSDVSEAGARHVAGTGLTVAGASATCALAVDVANLDRLSPGDHLTLRVLDERAACQVVRVAATDAAAAQWPEDGGEWCALVARDPAGAEDGQIVVTARRVSPEQLTARDDSRTASVWVSRLAFAAPVAAAGLILLVLIEGLRRSVRRATIKRMKL